jgi:hypothetical protein
MSELGQILYRNLRRYVEREGARTSVDDLARVVRSQLLRPGALPRMAPSRRADLFEDIVRHAERVHNPTDPRQVRGFVDAVLASIDAARPARRARFSDTGDLRRLVEDAVEAEYSRGKNDADVIHRAVTRAMKERKRGRGVRRVPLEARDPLREVLKIDPEQRVLHRSDVRIHLADQANTPLGEALKDSARFAEDHLRPILGEELWGLCRPIGFADKRRRRVLIEVASSALAQEIAMRRGELLARLKSAPGFERVQDLKFEVRAPPTSLPIKGR